jgi:hypothetical protein
MAFIPITPDLVENVTFALHPRQMFVSSSLGVSGSIKLINRPSTVIRQINPTTSEFAEGTLNSTEGYLTAASNNIKQGSTDVASIMSDYLKNVNSQSVSKINDISFSPIRYAQPINYTDNNGSAFILKQIVKETLMPYYRHGYSICDFSCGNYHALNFFSSSAGPNNTALIYANTDSALGRQYTPAGQFSIDFYINPRYLCKSGSSYSPGTIMHLSSTFALSLITGSSKDSNYNTDKFRLLLQLSQSADVPPSKLSIPAVETGLTFPRDLIFVTDDNTLSHNTWHHVTVRWGGQDRSYGSGSIVIDGVSKSFNVPSRSIATYENSDALIIGNYFQGSDYNGKFFNSVVAAKDGIPTFSGFSTEPTGFVFENQLQSELHDLKIFNRFLSDSDIDLIASASNSTDPDLLLYVPPLFTTITNDRDVLVTPFQTKYESTTSPFSIDMALGVNGFYMNLENFVKDYKSGQFPRLFNLSGSEITTTVLNKTANELLYEDTGVRKRNLTILPNDNSRQKPDFTPITQETSAFFVDDLDCVDHSIISMNDISAKTSTNNIATKTFFVGLPGGFNALGGATPENLNIALGPALTLSQRFKDSSSNQVVLFEMSNLGYGKNILPGTFELIDTNLSGSAESISIKIKDDGQGMLYRANSVESSKWSAVGNIFYNEGIAIITDPTLALFAKDQMQMSFNGEQRTPVMVLNIPCPASLINSSSNPTYKPFPVTQNLNEREDRFVYITGINLHDENLNVIMRANLAQPIAKRDSDEFMFRIKYDF